MKRHGFFSPHRNGGLWDYATDPAVLLSLFALGLCACDTEYDDAHPLLPLECTAIVCERLPSCAPILPGWNTGWDWRTHDSCLRSMTCGAERESCVRAVSDLICVGPGADPSAVDESIYEVWESCGRLGPEEGWGGGGGGRAWRENK